MLLNIIIPEISKIIINNEKSMIEINERYEFENECNQVIEKSILNYKDYYSNYIKNNKKILDYNIKSILQETSNLEILSHNYPLIKYFNVVNYPNYQKFLDEFNLIQNHNIKYPVITNYLIAFQKEEQKKFLESFHLINPFITYLLNKYSNKITREEAKKRKIINEIKKQ